MTEPRICVVSVRRDARSRQWTDFFDQCVTNAGLQAVRYEPSTVEQAFCLLAFPQGDDQILYQMGYALGVGLPVLGVVEEGDDLARLSPPPTQQVEVPTGLPQLPTDVAATITQKLQEIIRRPTQRSTAIPNRGLVDTTPGAHLIGSMDDAERQFEEFVADGLSQERIRELLTQAGCRQSWLNFRLRSHFGGW